ncbi:hypothetical protein V8E53_011055 [Lactarius tabidus]
MLYMSVRILKSRRMVRKAFASVLERRRDPRIRGSVENGSTCQLIFKGTIPKTLGTLQIVLSSASERCEDPRIRGYPEFKSKYCGGVRVSPVGSPDSRVAIVVHVTADSESATGDLEGVLKGARVGSAACESSVRNDKARGWCSFELKVAPSGGNGTNAGEKPGPGEVPGTSSVEMGSQEVPVGVEVWAAWLLATGTTYCRPERDINPGMVGGRGLAKHRLPVLAHVWVNYVI